jgi:hypothetical protein
MKARTLLVGLLAMLCFGVVGGCSSYTPSLALDREATRTTSIDKNSGHLTQDAYAFASDGLPGYTNVTPEGIDSLIHANPGAAGIGDYGVSLISPNPSKADSIRYEAYAVIEDAEGNQSAVLLNLVQVDGFESKPELLQDANVRGLQARASQIVELYQTNRAQYDAQMATVREVFPELADLVEGIVEGFAPGL